MPTYRIPVVITWPGPGSPGVNVWHMRTASLRPTDAAFDAGLARLKALYLNLAVTPINALNQANSYQIPTVTDVATGEQQVVDDNPFQNGQATNDAAPWACAIVAGWKTSIAARRARGRTFFGPVSRGSADPDGTISDSVLGKVRNELNDFVSDSEAANDWAFGVYGLENPGGNRTSPHVLRDFTGVVVRDQFAILRSRRD